MRECGISYPVHYLGCATVEECVLEEKYDIYIDLDPTDDREGVWRPSIWLCSKEGYTQNVKLENANTYYPFGGVRDDIAKYVVQFLEEGWWLCFTRDHLYEYGDRHRIRTQFAEYV